MAAPTATTGSTVSRVVAAISSMATTLVGSDMARVSAPSTRESGSTSYLRARCPGTRARISAGAGCWRTSTDGRPCSFESTSTSRSSVTRPRRASTEPSRSFERRCSRSASWSWSCEITPSATRSSPMRARLPRLRTGDTPPALPGSNAGKRAAGMALASRTGVLGAVTRDGGVMIDGGALDGRAGAGGGTGEVMDGRAGAGGGTAGPPTGLDEDRAEALAGVAREQSHHADGGPLVEDGEQDRVVVHGADVQALLQALVEEHRELALAQQPGERRRRAEGAGGEGGDGDRVEGARRAREGKRLAAAIDQQHGGAARVAEEPFQYGVDPRRVGFVDRKVVSHHEAPSCTWPNSRRRTIREMVLSVSKTPCPVTATASNAGTRRAPRLSVYSR